MLGRQRKNDFLLDRRSIVIKQVKGMLRILGRQRKKDFFVRSPQCCNKSSKRDDTNIGTAELSRQMRNKDKAREGSPTSNAILPKVTGSGYLKSTINQRQHKHQELLAGRSSSTEALLLPPGLRAGQLRHSVCRHQRVPGGPKSVQCRVLSEH